MNATLPPDDAMSADDVSAANDALRRMRLYPTIIVDVDMLVEDETNANEMSEEDFGALCRSIEHVGFLQPLLVVEGYDDSGSLKYNIIDGHHRKRAAVKLGMGKVTAILWDGTDAMLKAVQLGMNRIRGDFNLTKVSEDMARLVEQGWDAAQLAITGFSDAEISSLLDATVSAAEESALEGANAAPAEPAQGPESGGVLEIAFTDKNAMGKAKRALKRRATELGDVSDLGAALLDLLEDNE